MGGKASADTSNNYSPAAGGAINDPKGRQNLTLWDFLQPEGQQFTLSNQMQNPFAMFDPDFEGFNQPQGDPDRLTNAMKKRNRKNNRRKSVGLPEQRRDWSRYHDVVNGELVSKENGGR